MADQDYPTLYASLEASAERAADAAVSLEGILGGTENQTIPVRGFGNQPTVAKRVNDKVTAQTTPKMQELDQRVTTRLNQADQRIDTHLADSEAEIDTRLDAVESGLNIRKYASYAEMLSDPQTRDGVTGLVIGDTDPNLDGYYSWSNSTKRWLRDQEQPVLADTGFGDDILFAFLDAMRRQTWLGVNSKDGGPTAHAERLLRLLFGVFMNERTGYLAALTDANGLMTDLAIRDTDGQFDEFVIDRLAPRIKQRIPDEIETTSRTGYLFALRDSAGYLTDLCVDDATGQFPPFVVERLARRIVPYLPQAADSAWFLNDKYTDSNGDVQRVFTNMLSWSGWGSSTMDEWSELAGLAQSFGATYYNGGNGATELQHNMAQMGVRPALLLPAGGAIPASGQVVVACSNVAKNQAFKATAGTLQGVPGTLTCTSSDWIFTRAQSGAAVTVDSEQPFIPTQGLAHRGDLWLFNEGKNDINNGTPMAQLLAWHRLAFNWNSALSKRVLVLTHFGNNGRAGTEHIRKVEQLNAFIKSTYTDNVFDLQAYLCSSEIWADVGITPTAADLQNQAAGCLAASLSRDNDAHMKAATRAAVAEKIKQKLLTMGWFKA